MNLTFNITQTPRHVAGIIHIPVLIYGSTEFHSAFQPLLFDRILLRVCISCQRKARLLAHDETAGVAGVGGDEDALVGGDLEWWKSFLHRK